MVPQVNPQLVKAEDVKVLLQEHLTAGIIRIGRQWHIQTRGIPQVHPLCRPQLSLTNYLSTTPDQGRSLPVYCLFRCDVLHAVSSGPT